MQRFNKNLTFCRPIPPPLPPKKPNCCSAVDKKPLNFIFASLHDTRQTLSPFPFVTMPCLAYNHTRTLTLFNTQTDNVTVWKESFQICLQQKMTL